MERNVCCANYYPVLEIVIKNEIFLSYLLYHKKQLRDYVTTWTNVWLRDYVTIVYYELYYVTITWYIVTTKEATTWLRNYVSSVWIFNVKHEKVTSESSLLYINLKPVWVLNLKITPFFIFG